MSGDRTNERGAPGDAGWPALWPDSPWRMHGRHVTARFPVPAELVAAAVHPAIRPQGDADLVGRVRFWDLGFESLRPRQSPLAAPPAGRFGEAIVAFPASFGGEATETTAFMWSDSTTYLAWGREEFGWPTLPGEIDLDGELWTAPLRVDSSGTALCRTQTESIAMTELRVARSQPALPTGPPSFATMRRVSRLGVPGVETEAVRAKMQVLNRGRRYEADGALRMEFAAGHPLHGFAPTPISFEVVEGITCVVGEDVDIQPWSPSTGGASSG